MKKSLIALLIGSAFIAPSLAQAEDSYVSVNLGQSEYKIPGLKESQTAVGVAYGQSISEMAGYEVGYVNFGKWEDFKVQSIYLAGVAKYPVADAFAVFGKLGGTLNYYEVTDASETKLRLMAAVGVSYRFSKELEGTIDYSYFGKYSEVTTSLWSAGVRYHF